MPETSHKQSDASMLDLELYFLIVRFLSSGPCQDAAEVLKRELEQRKLLPRRTDWEGREHFRSLQDLITSYRHIPADHLRRICQRVGPLLDKEIPTNVTGVQSLLGAGKQSLLRTKESLHRTTWPASVHVANFHGVPPYPPRRLAHTPHPCHVLPARELSGFCRPSHMLPVSTFAKMVMHCRTLGHLSAVYCVAFDRTGEYIFTGADDHLVKIWNADDGRLLSTIRGHSAEIADLSVSYDNSLLAIGSCDKTIRVLELKTTEPVAVLHGHTDVITSLKFCPLVRGYSQYLLSTGSDGNVCYWQYNKNTHVFNPKPIKFIERSRAGAQMLCSSFSPGGIFLATGSSDHAVRVFCFVGHAPEKICELEAHTNRVDSIQYSNHGNRFISGSRDGTARIWRYDRQEWKAMLINMVTVFPGSGHSQPVNNDNPLQVTMVGWNMDDSLVFTAVTDYTIKVWDSHSGQLVHILAEHEDEVFVLENNPIDKRLLLSGGHDGKVFLWDIETGVVIRSFCNLIEGQGHGAVFDCKWSPDGLMFAVTDSHGHIIQFGLGSSDKYARNPVEMFFHTDYRPLMRDANDYVLDEQTQQPPHLMPCPFLVDVDGNPHPPHYQRLVPGREKYSDHQLVPEVGITPSGDREVIDQVFREPEPPPQLPAAIPSPAAQQAHHLRPSIDDMIEMLEHEHPDLQGGMLSPGIRNNIGGEPSGGRHVSNRGSEGVRQAVGENIPVSQQATPSDLTNLKQRIIIRPMDPVLMRCAQDKMNALGEEEMKKFVIERKKKKVPTATLR